MGLDGVELVLEIEDRFGISIPDDDAERIRTVGELCDYLLARARAFLGCPCPTASAFYRIRRALTDDLGIARSDVRPNTSLDSLLAKETRFQDWQRLSDDLGAAVPALRRSPMVRLALACFCLATISLPIITTMAIPHLATFLLSIVGAIVLLVAGFRLARPMATVIPESAATVGILSHTLVSRVYLPTDRDPAELDPWIFGQVCEIVADVLGVDRNSLSRDTGFVEDLGVG